MQYTITLSAGIEKRQEFTGRTLVILSIGAAASIDMKIELSGFAVEEMRGIKQGLKMQTDGFSGAKFLSAVDCTIEVIVSTANISVNYQEGQTVNANIVGTVPVSVAATLPVSIAATLPVSVAGTVAVSNDRGAPGTPVYVSGITYADAPAVTLQDNAAGAVTDAGAALVTANANRRALRFTNIGTDPVTIGFTGITWAKRCLVLEAGDTWTEDRAANLAWAGDCDTGKTASVTVQEVLA
jgi:hypothetical protein